MRKWILAIVIIIFIGAVAWAGVFYWQNLRGAAPAFGPPKQDITDLIPDTPGPAQNNTDFPLTLPDGFTISILAKDLADARDLVFDQRGNLWVSRRNAGVVTLLEIQNGRVVSRGDVFRNLRKPHGLAFDPTDPFVLYIAEEDKISRAPVYSEAPLEKIADLPTGGRHTTRSLIFGDDGRLYVSIGSSCDVCNEDDQRRAAVYVMDKDGSNFEPYATGLRNAVFMAKHPRTGEIWVTEMGRDHLGDNLPPDEINVLQAGNFGWPICYGKNVHDTSFDKNVYVRAPCSEPFEIPSYVDLQAHSAPLGLGFIPASWPAEYRADLLVAYHGSWNRTVPTGYKIVRLKFDDAGYIGTEDFISGWLVGNDALGRPVDIEFDQAGSLYVSDDKAGVVYKITYGNQAQADQSDLIHVSSPQPNDVIGSPLTVTGQARGFWFFEASFPVRLEDRNGNDIPLDPGYIMTANEWMTEEFVPFEGRLIFNQPVTEAGTLILMKDNPSGLPEHDDELRIPVRFSDETIDNLEDCVITGCSGQVCADQEVITICEFRREYICYKDARCERQADGQCGWTPTLDLIECLENNATAL